MKNNKSKVFSILLIFALILLFLPVTLLAEGEPESVAELGTMTPTYPGENVVLTLKNTSSSDITVEAPYKVKVDEFDTDQLDPSWILFEGIIPSGEEKAIASIPSGAGWRNWVTGKGGYGPFRESHYDIQAWMMINGEEWESNTVTHTIIPSPPCEEGEVCVSGTTFISDNKNGTCTIEVWVQDKDFEFITGLGKSDFVVGGEHLAVPPVAIGTIVGVTEKTPGTYNVIWSYDDGSHVVDVWTAGKTVALGLPVTISTTSTSQTKVVNDYTSGDPVDFYDGTVKMYVTTQEGSFAVEAYFYTTDEEKDAPENLQPARLFLNMSRSENIDGDTIRVELNYDSEELPEGMNEESMKLYRYNEETNSWDEVERQGVNVQEKYIWMEIDSFSTYGVFGEMGDMGELPQTGSSPLPLYYLANAILAGGAALIARRKK